MTYFHRKEIRYITLRTALLASLAAVVWYCHRPTSGTDLADKPFAPQEFHREREVVHVRADSLAALIGKIQENDKNAFTFEPGSEWTFYAKDRKAFERIFLDGEALADWNTEQRPSLQKLKDNAGFSVQTEKVNGVSYVKLPAEIMQSIQIAN